MVFQAQLTATKNRIIGSVVFFVIEYFVYEFIFFVAQNSKIPYVYKVCLGVVGAWWLVLLILAMVSNLLGTIFSVATVFLPSGSCNYGKHTVNNLDDTGLCWCHLLYGAEQEFGCHWFEIWWKNVEKAWKRRHDLIVKFKANQVGQGKVSWEKLPTLPFDTGLPGLGRSQVAEVAFCGLKGWKFKEEDVEQQPEDDRDLLDEMIGKGLYPLARLVSRFPCSSFLVYFLLMAYFFCGQLMSLTMKK